MPTRRRLSAPERDNGPHLLGLPLGRSDVSRTSRPVDTPATRSSKVRRVAPGSVQHNATRCAPPPAPAAVKALQDQYGFLDESHVQALETIWFTLTSAAAVTLWLARNETVHDGRTATPAEVAERAWTAGSGRRGRSVNATYAQEQHASRALQSDSALASSNTQRRHRSKTVGKRHACTLTAAHATIQDRVGVAGPSWCEARQPTGSSRPVDTSTRGRCKPTTSANSRRSGKVLR